MTDPKIKKLKLAKVRLVDTGGKQRGVFSLAEAEQIAVEEKSDLILVSEKADPPVVKLGDYRKFLYQQERVKKEVRKQRQELKGIRISFVEAEGDLLRKARQATNFLAGGNPVQVRLVLKGRQKLHQDFAREKLNHFFGLIETPFRFIQEIKKELNYFWATIAKR